MDTRTKPYRVLAAVGVGLFISILDAGVVNVALPTLERDLRSDFATIQWVVLSYVLTQTVLVLSFGRVGDILGRKTVYLTGYVTFVIGSALCAGAPSAVGLIAMRVLQAIGGASVAALGPAILAEAFPESERGKALGLSSAIVAFGMLAGPALGGAVLSVASWRWIFIVNVPLGVVGVASGIRLIPSDAPRGGQRFDVVGAVTLFVALGALVGALTAAPLIGLRDPRVVGLLATSLVVGAVFVAVERASRHPMVHPELFRERAFTVGLTVGFGTFVCVAGAILILPFFLQGALGYTPLQVGLVLATVPVFVVTAAPVAGALSDRVGALPLTTAGLIGMICGFLSFTRLDEHSSWWAYAGSLAPVGMGLGLFQSPNNSAILGAVGQRRLGIASGMIQLARSFGQTVGMAAVGGLWVARLSVRAGAELAPGVVAQVPVQVGAAHDAFVVLAAALGVALVFGLARAPARRPRAVTAPGPGGADAG